MEDKRGSQQYFGVVESLRGKMFRPELLKSLISNEMIKFLFQNLFNPHQKTQPQALTKIQF